MRLNVRTVSGAVLEFTEAPEILSGYTSFLQTGRPIGGAGCHIVFNFAHVEFIEVFDDEGTPSAIDFNNFPPKTLDEVTV